MQVLSGHLELLSSARRFLDSLRTRLPDPVSNDLTAHPDLGAHPASSSRTDTLPVRYIFPKRPLDPSSAVKSLLSAAEESWGKDAKGTETGGVKKLVVVIWDVSYDWLSGTLRPFFQLAQWPLLMR